MKIIDIDIVVPILVKEIKPNSIIIPKPTLISRGSSSIEVEQTFQCDVDYYGGVGIEQDGAVDAKLVKNHNTMTATFTGLSQDTEYTIKGVGLPILGNETIGEGLVVRTKASPIPNEYQLVEYLESDGRQYINTLLSDLTIGMYIEGRIIISLQDDTGFCGNVNPSNVIWWDRNQYLFMWRGTSYYTGVRDISVNKKFELNYLQSGEAKIDDVVFASFTNTTNNLNRILLFGAWYGRPYGIPIAQIVNAKFSIGVNKVRDMYPVYRKSDNKPGMYDIVNGTFYTNQGTGKFLVGPDKEWEE